MITDPEKYSITEFMKYARNEIKNDCIVLDAGAGNKPYRQFFLHTNYESTDIKLSDHTFVSNLNNIPKPRNYYDAVINTQVLEHVEDPEKVLKELNRILKKGGKLFLTAPQGWGIHEEPYNYFYFTKYGLEILFKKAGFNIIFINPRGGIFWYLSALISKLPSYLINQINNKRRKMIYLPIYAILKPFCNYLIPAIFFYLDKLDKNRRFTLGYACYCIKP